MVPEDGEPAGATVPGPASTVVESVGGTAGVRTVVASGVRSGVVRVRDTVAVKVAVTGPTGVTTEVGSVAVLAEEATEETRTAATDATSEAESGTVSNAVDASTRRAAEAATAPTTATALVDARGTAGVRTVVASGVRSGVVRVRDTAGAKVAVTGPTGVTTGVGSVAVLAEEATEETRTAATDATTGRGPARDTAVVKVAAAGPTGATTAAAGGENGPSAPGTAVREAASTALTATGAMTARRETRVTWLRSCPRT
ncbi:hypothetical protein SAMN02745673_03063 [Marinactinospora thermotolerans DSM 45154]|uniref:Uncharacterized protein n=1 Tax=Marinactinospora thermotolerans DSM 45154 TaxID=1122192 RepID=A0A1T4S0V1_9ACTN|nr:hypothetical protein SAMN02745673_03063 [Marinactinospora thermotolerans DSM 45154]